jgi:anaerobic ribonucleoside-triphosphate reductase activating protein
MYDRPVSPALRVHAIERRSRANGPGVRFAIWVQGCSLGCPGCFNPGTHSGEGGEVWPVERLAAAIAAEGAAIEGVTISGGEPLEQPVALLGLVEAVRHRCPGLSILVFSGYALEEIERMPPGPALLAAIDVLVDGRYLAGERLGSGLRGSANQKVRLLSRRYTIEEVEATPVAEVVIGADGLVRLSGVRPVRLPGARPPGTSTGDL